MVKKSKILFDPSLIDPLLVALGCHVRKVRWFKPDQQKKLLVFVRLQPLIDRLGNGDRILGHTHEFAHKIKAHIHGQILISIEKTVVAEMAGNITLFMKRSQ